MSCHPACTLGYQHKGPCYDSTTDCDLSDAMAQEKRIAYYKTELDKALAVVDRCKTQTIKVLARETARLARLRLEAALAACRAAGFVAPDPITCRDAIDRLAAEPERSVALSAIDALLPQPQPEPQEAEQAPESGPVPVQPTLSLRASSMPLAWRCAGSVRSPQLRVHETGEAAALGTTVHEALRGLARKGRVDWPSLHAVASAAGVPEDELRALCSVGEALYNEVADSFPAMMSEVALELEPWPHVRLTGHVDGISIRGSAARILDFKSGRKDSDYSQQMRAYLTLVLQSYPEITEATATVLWLRESGIENYTMTRAQSDQWLAELRTKVVDWNGTYETGTHCQYCPRSHECEAFNCWARRDAAIILDERQSQPLSLMSPDSVIELAAKASMMEAAAKRVRSAIRAYVEMEGDVIGTSHKLTLQKETRRSLDTEKAWGIVEVSVPDMAEVVSITLTEVESIVAKQAGKGKGAAAVRELHKKLISVGALRTSSYYKMVTRRI